eukprot:947791-Ditylum_brightwellii.AAC.1
MKAPGMELVAISHVVDKKYFALGVDRPDAFETQRELIQSIVSLDKNSNKTFDGGFNALVRWYRE